MEREEQRFDAGEETEVYEAYELRWEESSLS